MPAAQIQQTMVQFQKQNEIADMKQEMMEDILDSDAAEEAEGFFCTHDILIHNSLADEAIDQVLDSIGLDVAHQVQCG